MRMGVARIEDQIFIIGGTGNAGSLSEVESYSILKKEWKEISPMNQKRYRPGVGVVDDKIFVIGGSDDGGCLNTCEMFDEKAKKWEMIPSMTTKKI